MCDEWMPTIQLAVSPAQFRQLPRHPGFRYEYLDGRAHLTPRARHYHAMLDLDQAADAPAELPAAVRIRPMTAEDVPLLEPVFAAAFHTIQPFGSLDDETLWQAAHKALDKTQSGGDGPWIVPASFVAEQDGHPAGALFVTLLPDGDPCEWDSYYWKDPAPPDAIARRQGRPHLTWVFVSPWLAGSGVGSALLASAVRVLREMGFRELLTTFMIGNDGSMLWHWRNGFRLLAHPTSARLRRG